MNANSEAKGYHIFTNRYFTEIPLTQKLLKLIFYLTDTIQTNRKYILDMIKKPAVKNNNVAVYKSGDILLLT